MAQFIEVTLTGDCAMPGINEYWINADRIEAMELRGDEAGIQRTRLYFVAGDPNTGNQNSIDVTQTPSQIATEVQRQRANAIGNLEAAIGYLTTGIEEAIGRSSRR